MKSLIAVALLFSAQAFACPDLTGNYECQYPDGSSENVTISQSNKAGVEVYTYNGSQIPADNVTYPMPDSQNIKEGQFRAWCDDNSTLKANMIGKYWDGGSYVGDLNLDLFMSIENGSLKSVTSGSLKTGNAEHPIDSTTTCQRI